MRFQVPQFIDIEDKIFGPLTLKQFIYLAGGGGLIFILYALLPLFMTIILGIPAALLALALAFYQMNGQPFVKVLENAFRYSTSSKLYLWKKSGEKKKSAAAKVQEQKIDDLMYMPKLTTNKLEELSWSLDVKERAREEATEEQPKN